MSGDLTHAPGDKLKPKPPVEAPNFTGMTKASFRQYWVGRARPHAAGARHALTRARAPVPFRATCARSCGGQTCGPSCS